VKRPVAKPGAAASEFISPSDTARERAILSFATLQFFAIIYLEKLALFPTSFALPLDMLIMFAGVGWMIVSGNLSFVPLRLAIFLPFLAFCFASEAFANGSLPSITELVLLYIPMTLCANLSDKAYRTILNRFTMLMVFPAVIMIVQFTYQKLTGLSDPIDMERFVPKSLLMPGFFYNAHYPWNSTFSRPNGFFFLEPSVASTCTAIAAILEITYFRRSWCVALMLLATLLSLAATGATMLFIAVPFLLYREDPRVAALMASVAVVTLVSAYMLNLPLPFSRADEFSATGSSTNSRLDLPLQQFLILLNDPSYLLIGAGPGSSSVPIYGNTWPMVKLLREYGLLATTAFLVLYIVVVVDHPALALKVSLSVMYLFAGGNLLTPPAANLVILLLFILIPRRRELSKARSIAIPDIASRTWRHPG
jgi:hypothetical protein